MIRVLLPIPQGRQRNRDEDGLDVVFDHHMDGMGSNVRTMGTAMTIFRDNQKVDRKYDD